MPFARTQSLLKKTLPEPVFDWLYRVATAGYYARQKVADWWYYRQSSVIVNAIKIVRPYTMVGRGGLVATFNVAQQVCKDNIAGCFVECGVARGGCSLLMQLASLSTTGRTRVEWLFDSFEGLPEPTTEDGVLRKPQGKDRRSWDLVKGYCLGTLEEVEDLLFNEFGFSRDKVHLVKGWFQDTLPQYKEQVGNIAVLRIDGDWYESTKCCLANLYEQVVDGGYVIIDDYALVGCRKAVDEFFAGKEYPDMVLDGRGGGWFRKKEAVK